MGGSSKAQTVGYRYSLGAHLALCHGPVDAIREIRIDDRTAWSIGTGTTTQGADIGAQATIGTVAGMSATAGGAEDEVAYVQFPGSLAGIRLGAGYELALGTDGVTVTVTVQSIRFDGDNDITTWLVTPKSTAFAAQSVTVKEAASAGAIGSGAAGGRIRIDKLQALRDRLGKPLIVRSAYRSPEHNRAIGGAPRSKHMDGAAFDIAMANHDPHAFEQAARAVGFLGFGFYPEPRNDFIHIDLGPEREWGTRWPEGAPAFSPELPAPKPLAQSRTMRGSGAAGVATVGAAGVEMVRDAAAETQAALEPLIPWLDGLRWLFIAAALAGIAVAIYARWDDWHRGRR